MNGLYSALRTLTLIPAPNRKNESPDTVLIWFPVVGLILGLLCGLPLLLPGAVNPVSAVLCVVLSVLLTRGMNLAGLFSFCSKPTAGPHLSDAKEYPPLFYGVTATALILIMKSIALYALRDDAWLWLICAMVISRAMQVEQMERLPTPADDPLAPLSAAAGPRHRLVVLTASAVLAVMMLKITGLLVFAGAWGLNALLRRYLKDHTSGAGHQTLGTTGEIIETAVLALPILFATDF